MNTYENKFTPEELEQIEKLFTKILEEREKREQEFKIAGCGQKEPRHIINFSIPESQYKTLKNMAYDRHTNMSSIIRKLLFDFMMENGKMQIVK